MARTRSSNTGRGAYLCSFCGRGQEEVQRLIAGPGTVCICDECVALCSAIIAEEAEAQPVARGIIWRRRGQIACQPPAACAIGSTSM